MSGADTRLPHVSILASAGSGKTFQLTNRYLTLVAAGAPIGGLLASTFTRVAAAEIRDRILVRLAVAADDDRKRADLGPWIGRRDLERSDVVGLLRKLTSNLHLLRIRTLDSFFDTVVRAYAIELGIASGSRIVDEAEARAMRLEAIRAVLDATTSDTLVRLLRRMTQGGSDRSVMRTIDDAVTNLYELYRESDAAAWSRLTERRELTNRELADVIDEIDRMAPTLTGLAKTMRQDVARARASDWEGMLKAGITAKVTRGETVFSRKPLPPEVIAVYSRLCEHIVAVLWNRIARQTIATREMLELFDRQYRLVKQRRRALTFDDLTAAMATAMSSYGAGGRFDEICFRLDATVDHLLLDEFQDTNVQQWRALAPLVTEILDDHDRGRTFFCVGDVKQSIFGWRDACPEVLGELPALRVRADGTPLIEEQKLARSFRSSQVVIDVVNRVFGSIRDFPVMSEHARAAAQFASGFDDHFTARKDLLGYAELRTVRRAPADAGRASEQKKVRLRDAAELVARLYGKAPHRKIAVLTRKNASVARLLFEFSGARLDIPATGRGGGPLTDAPAVNAILDLLRMADHPDDTVAAFNVARGPLGEVVGLTDEQDQRRRRRVASAVRRRLLEHGYAATIAGWTTEVAPWCDERGFRRLLQLVDLAGTYDARATLRADEFVRVVEQIAVADAVPAPVQVMTVHQSKGLEFNIVVLPDLEEQLVGQAQAVVFERDGVTGPVERVCRWVNTDTRNVLPELEEMFDIARQRTVRESLSLLYVALTRAKQGLFMLIDPPKLKKDGTESAMQATPAGVLRCALTDESTPAPETVIYTHGDPIWIGAAAPEAETPVPRAPTPAITLAAAAAPPFRGIAAPSASQSAHAATLRAELAVRDAEPLDRGSALHRLFEQVEWLETFTRDRAALARLVKTTAPRRDTAWCDEVVNAFLAALEQPAVRAVLSLGEASPARTRVWTERPFVRLVDGRLQQGSIDRLVAHLDEDGRVRRATVIDYKSDVIEAAGAEDRAEHYRGQVEDYRAITAHIFGLDPTDVEMTLLFVRPGVATTLWSSPRAVSGR